MANPPVTCSAEQVVGSVQVEFTAGYGDATDVPQSLGLPAGAKRLLDMLRTGTYL